MTRGLRKKEKWGYKRWADESRYLAAVNLLLLLQRGGAHAPTRYVEFAHPKSLCHGECVTKAIE